MEINVDSAQGAQAELGISTRRNYVVPSHRRDSLIEWMKEMLHHSFALDAKDSYEGTMGFFEDLIEEFRRNPKRSRLIQLVPSVGVFHTPLPMADAFRIYDTKYCITRRRHIAPTFNEIRHILNLAQIMAIGETLKLITFDGDQTLYSDGGNFDATNDELALAIIRLLCHGVRVAVVTAAGYGFVAAKYETRLQGLLTRFVDENMPAEAVGNFYVFGGESNYLFRCELQQMTVDGHSSGNTTMLSSHSEPSTPHGPAVPKAPSAAVRARLVPLPVTDWQADELGGPRPFFWPEQQVQHLLDVAEATFTNAVSELKLRARVLRKERSCGVFPGGAAMIPQVPTGHGSKRLKREALDELALRVLDAIRTAEPPIDLPYCVFNGGTDAWLDVGNKRVALEALQCYLKLAPETTLHVGDQFYNLGNDLAARDACPCIWITSPRETGKVLQHVLRYHKIAPISHDEGTPERYFKEGDAAKLNVYTGETL